LIKGAIEESGVDSNDWVQTSKCHASSTGHCVLFCDSYIDGALRKCCCKLIKASWPKHRGGNCHDIFALSANVNELIGKDLSP